MALVICLSAAALVWIGYRAVVEWEQAAGQVAARRAEAAVDLLAAALGRDMRSVQQVVLTSADRDALTVGPAIDLLRPIGSALVRYPYPEAFFSWRGSPSPDSVIFYSRPERRPGWLTVADRTKMFPVVVGREDGLAARLIDRIAKDSAQSRRFSVFDLDVNGSPHQIVALVSYADSLRERPASVLGFMVNLEWVRHEYFKALTAQLSRMADSEGAIELTVLDDGKQPVAGPEMNSGRLPAGQRTFPLAFFDPLIVSVDPPPDLHVASYVAIANAEHDPTLLAARRGASWALGIAGVMAVVMAAGIWLVVQAGRASANLADMRSDFVSAVTHELKTPIANLRAIQETLASGRATMEMSREYAAMGIREANRLARLVDNLLAYARITDVAHAYAFEPVALEAVVDRSVKEFAPNLTVGNFELHIELPDNLPPVLGDPTALSLMLNNLLDNAIRYSKDRRHVTISGRSGDKTVALEVTDKGVGIPADEIQRVTRKFWRGGESHAGGSGLGLAIVDRIVSDHRGTLEIRSTVGVGTTVAITLPQAV
jgi:signal transduction histidine kinase